eukprot:TRINITY_DN8484_c0_g1_i1.p1 TRINITY_DN8484_c0_g1~~TRINITY_DN8484_c0_g1_i1.p1  ORF type:complete len:130 (+),score=56.88 TRINITY_DN8484_c0_g1_i1:542-931(+)
MNQMLNAERSQCVLVSGESGAGKTETAKHLMRWITSFTGGTTFRPGEMADYAAGKVRGSLEERIMAANPILEAFGNARTARNRNSSRFGKLTKVFFNKVSGRACLCVTRSTPSLTSVVYTPDVSVQKVC